MVLYSGFCPDVLFFMDRKPWKMAKSGRGDAATALVWAAGGDDVIWCNRPTVAIMVLVGLKCSMCCKLMACVIHSHVH